MKIQNLCILLSLMFTLTLRANTDVEESELRSYPIADQGNIEINVPKTWQSVLEKNKNNVPITIRFSASEEPALDFYITPVWVWSPEMHLPSDDGIRRLTEKAAREEQSQAVEKNLQVLEIKRADAVGYYFSATDRKPKKGEFKYLTQGHIRSGELLMIFTALSNDDSRVIDHEVLEAMKSAVFHRNPATAITTIKSSNQRDAIQIGKDLNDLILTVPVSRIVMRIPKGNLEEKANSNGGAASSPRYFYFVDASRQLIISGWFESADGYKGMKKMWNENIDAWRKAGVPLPENPSFGSVGHWDVVNYEVAKTDPAPTHIRACLVQAGTWIDMHLSIGNTPNQDSREALTEILRGICDLGKTNLKLDVELPVS